MKETKDKKTFARASWRQVKRALKLLFERRLDAEIVEMRFTSTWSSAAHSLLVVCKDTAGENCRWLRWAADHEEVQAESWIDLANVLEASAKEGKFFSIGRKTVFGPRDSIERALVEADLFG